MKKNDSVMEYYYSSKLFNLKITASLMAITSIDFTTPGKHRSDNVPNNVDQLFTWLDDYNSKKSDTLFNIIISERGADVNNTGKKCIVLDISQYTDLEKCVYRELVKVKAGKTISYGELAARSGIPSGGRFVGNVMAKNRFPVIIPCHRVIKADGSTGNYSGGTGIKEKLLLHESSGFSPVRY